MSSLAELDFTYRRFLDKLTMLYGESGSGKSYAIVDILYQLKPHIDQIVIFSPTDRQNHTYDKGIAPLPFIHYTITPKLLSNLWERQEALVNVYTRASNENILSALYKKCPNRKTADRTIERVNDKLCEYAREIARNANDFEAAKTKCEPMIAECKKLIIMIWRQTIGANRDRLGRMKLTKEERYSLDYLDLNPRLVVVFDDCTDLLKKYKTHEVIQKLFYQGRHSMVTTLIACHTDKAIDAELRKNAFTSIFTSQKTAHAFFTRPSNDFDKAEQRAADELCKIAFSPLAGHQKLAFVRAENKYYRFTSKSHPGFRFGSPAIWDYCDKIKAESGTISADNRFIGGFM